MSSCVVCMCVLEETISDCAECLRVWCACLYGRKPSQTVLNVFVCGVRVCMGGNHLRLLNVFVCGVHVCMGGNHLGLC